MIVTARMVTPQTDPKPPDEIAPFRAALLTPLRGCEYWEASPQSRGH